MDAFWLAWYIFWLIVFLMLLGSFIYKPQPGVWWMSLVHGVIALLYLFLIVNWFVAHQSKGVGECSRPETAQEPTE